MPPAADTMIEAGTRLVLVRHGEALCNVEEYIGGINSCKGLTEKGKRQAACLGERLQRSAELAGADAIYASVLPRAIETAQIIAPRIGLSKVHTSAAFSEREPGEADGLSWAEFAIRYQRESLPGDLPDLPLSPGGESWLAFVARAAGALAAIACANPGALVIVVTHGGVIDASLISFLGISDYGTKVRLHPEHTSLTEWLHSGTRWRLVRYNDAAHLLEPSAHDLSSDAPPWLDAR